MLIKILVIICGAILTCFSITKFIKCVINLSVFSNKNDNTLKHEGIVINKESKKLEADNSPILPF